MEQEGFVRGTLSTSTHESLKRGRKLHLDASQKGICRPREKVPSRASCWSDTIVSILRPAQNKENWKEEFGIS